LLVDDEKSMQDVLNLTLKSEGYSPFLASTGEEALHKFQLTRPGLILLDLFLPDMDGKDVLRSLREWTSTPIVVMSVRHEESEKIACLDAGADDYLTKPFNMGELLARLRNATRRAFGSARNEIFVVGPDLRVDFNRREVLVREKPVKLTATEYDLLSVLIRHAGLVRTHHQLIRELWGNTQYQDAVHLLRVTVSNLRKKVCSTAIPRYIITEPGVGYRLRTETEWIEEPELN